MMLNTEFVIIVIAVISFAGLGTFIRTGLSVLIAPFNFFSLIPNIVGSFILGIIKGAGLKNQYINKGIGTGLCGSITTFSSFNYEFNILIISNNPNIPLALLFIILTFGISAIAFYIGELISKYISSKVTVSSCTPKQKPDVEMTNQIDMTESTCSIVSIVSIQIENNIEANEEIVTNDTVCLHEKNDSENIIKDTNELEHIASDGKDQTQAFKNNTDIDSNIALKTVLQWICILVLMNVIVIPLCFVIDNRLWLASLLAPFGAMSRWYLGLKFNKNDRFGIPIGTLMANIIGSLLLTVVIVISKESEDSRDETIWIEAITKGFCGCFSTVSSFVGELLILQRDAMDKIKNGDGIGWKDKIKTFKLSGIYFFVTIVIAQMLSSIPNGISYYD